MIRCGKVSERPKITKYFYFYFFASVCVTGDFEVDGMRRNIWFVLACVGKYEGTVLVHRELLEVVRAKGVPTLTEYKMQRF